MMKAYALMQHDRHSHHSGRRFRVRFRRSAEPVLREHRARSVAAVSVTLRSGRVEIASKPRRDVRLRLTTKGPELPWHVEADGRLQIDGRHLAARVQLDVPLGVPVQARVKRGDVTMWGAAGDLELSVSRGIVAGRELTAATVRVQCPRGEVNLHFAEPPLEVDAESRSAPVRIVLPSGEYVVDAASPQAAEVTVATGESGHRIRAASRTSSVSVLAAEAPKTI
jgi:hypothetical protein